MTIDERLDKLKAAVKAAENEAVTAVMFHETWKPTAYDNELLERMGESFATHSFQIIRSSLRREMLLALMRLWDSNHQAIRMTKIRDELRNKEVFDALVAARVSRIGINASGLLKYLSIKLDKRRKEVISLIEKYLEGGTGHATFLKIRALRDEHLAHRQITPSKAPLADASDKDIELFYEDTLEIVRLLLSLVLAVAFDLSEASKVYSHHAKFFWINARGERTEGHPNFHPPVPVVD
ncbi:hypothetical protein [uncultured Oxalobacter sp.]|uniref:AbiU2 domain-containing protein n=1 Tax=uncultured Oxalobacter sp. TaxID=337245 RepID=UPI0025981B2E|nr:hypothetical protein [uncultured Oxalobacter sp.]